MFSNELVRVASAQLHGDELPALLGAEHEATFQVRHLRSIEPPDHLRPVMGWLSGPPYPWCPPSVAIKDMPELFEPAEIRQFIVTSAS